MVERNLDLPRVLYWSRLRWQRAGAKIGEDECLSVGNLALVESSWQYPDSCPADEFRPYAARAIFHAVSLASFRERSVKGWGSRAGVRLPLDLYALADRETRLDPADLEAVLLVVGRLSEEDRSYLLDRLVRDLTFQQMAEARGISKTNVQKWFAVAMRRARALADHLGGGCSE